MENKGRLVQTGEQQVEATGKDLLEELQNIQYDWVRDLGQDKSWECLEGILIYAQGKVIQAENSIRRLCSFLASLLASWD